MDFLSNYPLEYIENRIEQNKHDFKIQLKTFKHDESKSVIKRLIMLGRCLINDYMKLYQYLGDFHLLKKGFTYVTFIEEIYLNGDEGFERDKVKLYMQAFLYCVLIGDNEMTRKFMKKFENHVMIHKHLHEKNNTTLHVMIELYKYLTQINIDDDDGNVCDIEYVGCMDNRIGVNRYELFKINCDFSRTLQIEQAIILTNTKSQWVFLDRNVDCILICQSLAIKTNTYNPVKCYIYFQQEIYAIMTGIEDKIQNLSEDGALLIYLNGDSCLDPIDNNKVAIKLGDEEDEDDTNVLIDIDLTSARYYPCVIIIDTEYASNFYILNKQWKSDLLLLLSPDAYPTIPDFAPLNGRLFTLFLTSPIRAFFRICNKPITEYYWNKVNDGIGRFMMKLLNWLNLNLYRYDKIKPFLNDVRIRNYFLRYIFCGVCLRLHRDFKVEHLPMCNYQELEMQILDVKELFNIVEDMATELDASDEFAHAENLSIRN